MTSMYEIDLEIPKAGQKWCMKTDSSKVLTVNWCNTCFYVSFDAPWMKKKESSICSLDTFHKRYRKV